MTDIKISLEVRAHLQTLENERGQLTPAVVVADAKRPESPLHALFEWDVEAAARKYWLHQARVIIHSVRLVSSSETVTIAAPYYVRDPTMPGGEQGYVSVAELRKSPEQARESVRLEFGRAESALLRARSVADALNMSEEIDQLMKQLLGLRERLEDDKAKREAA
jgi:hypothetical protein